MYYDADFKSFAEIWERVTQPDVETEESRSVPPEPCKSETKRDTPLKQLRIVRHVQRFLQH